MPANTPIYGFTYPCPGDTVDAASFATLANQIDTRLSSLVVDENWALGRYNVAQTMTPNQAGIANGVETALVNANSTYVIPADGVYVAQANLVVAGSTNTDSARGRIRLNGVPVAGRTSNNDPAALSTAPFTIPGVPMVCVTGDTISVAVLWFGVGTATATLRLQVRMIVRTL